MKVTAVRAIPLEAPLDPKAQVTAYGPRLKAAMVLVEIETDNGIVGLGEALARYSLRAYVSVIEDLLAPLIVGRDPFEVEGIWQQMMRVYTGKAGGLLLEALAACDIALWDNMGKSCGQPLHKILGSMGRTHVKAYASSISWAEDDIAIAQTEKAVSAGFKAIKIKIGPPAERAIARARLVREIAGDDIELTADGNFGFDFDQSAIVGDALAELGYEWFEEPIIAEDVEGYQRLRQRLRLRLAAGESEHTVYGCRTLISTGAVGMIQPDPARAGGITETRRIAALAYAFNIPFAPHIGFCGAVCAAASIQLSAAMPNFATYEAMTFDNPLRSQLATLDVTAPEQLVDGGLPVPDGPGLGIEVDPDALRRFRVDQ